MQFADRVPPQRGRLPSREVLGNLTDIANVVRNPRFDPKYFDTYSDSSGYAVTLRGQTPVPRYPFQLLADTSYVPVTTPPESAAPFKRRIKVRDGKWIRVTGKNLVKVMPILESTFTSAATASDQPGFGEDFATAKAAYLIDDGEEQWWSLRIGYTRANPTMVPGSHEPQEMWIQIDSTRPDETSGTLDGSSEQSDRMAIVVLGHVKNTKGSLEFWQEWCGGHIKDSWQAPDAETPPRDSESTQPWVASLDHTGSIGYGLDARLQEYNAHKRLVTDDDVFAYDNDKAFSYFICDMDGKSYKDYCRLDSANFHDWSGYGSLEVGSTVPEGPHLQIYGFDNPTINHIATSSDLLVPDVENGLTVLIRKPDSNGNFCVQYADLYSFKPDTAGHADTADGISEGGSIDCTQIVWDWDECDLPFWRTGDTGVDDTTCYGAMIKDNSSIYAFDISNRILYSKETPLTPMQAISFGTNDYVTIGGSRQLIVSTLGGYVSLQSSDTTLYTGTPGEGGAVCDLYVCGDEYVSGTIRTTGGILNDDSTNCLINAGGKLVGHCGAVPTIDWTTLEQVAIQPNIHLLIDDGIYQTGGAQMWVWDTDHWTSDTGFITSGSIEAGTLTDGTASFTGGELTGATGNISMWTNDEGYITEGDLLGTSLTNSLHVIGRASEATTGTSTPSGTTVSGTGTHYQDELVVGDELVINGQARVITAITSQTELTVNAAYDDETPAIEPTRNPAVATFGDGTTSQLTVSQSGVAIPNANIATLSVSATANFASTVVAGPETSAYGRIQASAGLNGYVFAGWDSSAASRLFSVSNYAPEYATKQILFGVSDDGAAMAGPTAGSYFWTYGGDPIIFQNYSSGGFDFWQGGSGGRYDMRISYAGNVVIGGTYDDGSGKLQVVGNRIVLRATDTGGSTGTALFEVCNSQVADGNYILFGQDMTGTTGYTGEGYGTTGVGIMSLGQNGGYGAMPLVLHNYDAAPIIFHTGGSEWMRVAASTGNLLIGNTVDGLGKLQLYSDSNTPCVRFYNSSNTSYRSDVIPDTTSNGFIWNSYDDSSYSYLPFSVNSSLLVTGTQGNVTVGSAVDDTVNKLQITGNTKMDGGFIGKITTVDDTYTVLSNDYTVVCNKATAFTVTLPTAVVGQKFVITNINAGVVTLQGDGSDTISGDANQTIYQWESVQVQCYAANAWAII